MTLLHIPVVLTCLAALAVPTAAHAAAREKQLVLISFDGAGDNRLWARSRAMAERSGARFTYFLSCTNLIDRRNAESYKAPGKKAGRSNVGFAPSADDIAVRLDHIWSARQEGHEIASHGCGHFDGGDWTKDDWLTEMRSFDRVMAEAWQANGLAEREPAGWRDFVARDIRGFRAPYLSTSPALAAAERAAGYDYDASPVARGPEAPGKVDGVHRFGLPLIPEGPKARPIVAMDYNLFVRHSMGVDNPSRSAEFEERAHDAFRTAFEKQYRGGRIPLQIGFHFVEMNAGAYWRALERLVDEVCGMQDVACVSYSQALRMAAEQPELASTERDEPGG